MDFAMMVQLFINRLAREDSDIPERDRGSKDDPSNANDYENILKVIHECAIDFKKDDYSKTLRKSLIKLSLQYATYSYLPKIQDESKSICECFTNKNGLWTFKMGQNHHYFACVMTLLEASLPRFIARKFHCMQVTELARERDLNHIIGVMVWFTMICNTHGLQFLHVLYEKLNETKKFDKDFYYSNISSDPEDPTWLWLKELLGYLRSVGQANNFRHIPNQDENVKNPMTFLLEPCILVQLPWNMVLFHQWLTMAFTQVLLFEKDSLLLRRWPLPQDLEPVARTLLFMTSQLRERLLLGFNILNQMIISFPDVKPEFRALILDEVVLPSLSMLKFLDVKSGKAYDVLTNLEKKMLSEYSVEERASHVYVSPKIFEIDVELENSFTQTFYNLEFWEGEPRGVVDGQCVTIDLDNVVKRMNERSKDFLPSKEYRESSVVKNENVLKEFILKNTSTDQRWKVSLTTIKQLIFDNYLRDSIFLQIKEACETADSEQIAGEEVFRMDCNELTDLQRLIVDGTIFHCVFEEMSNSESNSALFRIIGLQQQMHLHELETKIIHSIFMFLKIPLFVCRKRHDKAPPLKVGSMVKMLQQIQKKTESQKRDWLWSQFPTKWQKTVNESEPEMKQDLSVENVVKLCEERIGRIIVNVAKSCFQVYEDGGEIFPHWQTVQYLMPCLLLIYIENTRRWSNASKTEIKNVNYNFVKLLHGLLLHYEKSFHSWTTELKPREIDLPEFTTDASLNVFQQLNLSVDYYVRYTQVLMTSHLSHTFSKDFLFGEENKFRRIQIFSQSWRKRLCGSLLEHVTALVLLYQWYKKLYVLLKDWYDVSIEVWNFPSEEVMNSSSELKSLFVTNELILGLENAYSNINETYVGIPVKPHETMKSIVEAEENLFVSRTKLFIIFSQPRRQNQPRESLYEIYGSLKSALLRTYIQLKRFRSSYTKVEIFENPWAIKQSPEQMLAVEYYKEGDFVSLDKMLSLLLEADIPLTLLPSTMAKCRKCPEYGDKKDDLIVCEKCVKDDYPDVNYYCSFKCKKLWWKQEHMAEHLEFELGLMNLTDASET